MADAMAKRNGRGRGHISISHSLPPRKQIFLFYSPDLSVTPSLPSALKRAVKLVPTDALAQWPTTMAEEKPTVPWSRASSVLGRLLDAQTVSQYK